jgi:hypothetical protein
VKSLVALVALLAGCSSSSRAASGGPSPCATDSDCSGGAVCGYDNTGSSYGNCSARGVCVTPVGRQTTMLCGCGGKSIDLVVDDPDAGVYYWSGVIVGEQGFPPCRDAAVAPSSAMDASSQ